MFTPRARIWVLIGFGLLMVAAGVGIGRLRFDFSFEAFLPSDDPELGFFLRHRAQFNSGKESIGIAIRRQPSVFDRAFLGQVDTLCRAARKLPRIEAVTSLTTLKDYVSDPLFPSFTRVLDWRRSQDLLADSARICTDPRMVGNFISQDGQMLLVQLSLPTGGSDAEEAALHDSLFALLGRSPFTQTHVVGFPIMHHQLVELQQSQFKLYVVLALVVMVLCIWVVFGRLLGTLVAIFSVIGSMVLFFGALGWMGKPLDLMATLYPILLVIVGISDVTHIVSKYVDELGKGLAREDAIRVTMREIGYATFLTAITTSVGLWTQLLSPMPPIRLFGWYAGLGVMLTYVAVVLVTPALISFFPADFLMQKRRQGRMFDPFLARMQHWALHRSARVWLVIGLVCVLSTVGILQISDNLSIRRDLPWRSRVLADFVAVDTTMGGLNTADLALEAGAGHHLQELPVIQALDALEQQFLAQPHVHGTYSPNTFVRLANRYRHDNNAAQYAVPTTDSALSKLLPILQGPLAGSMQGVLSADRRTGNLYVKVPDIGSNGVAVIRDAVDSWAAAHLDSTLLRIRHTGQRYIFDINQGALARSQLWSVLLSIGIVALFFAIAFRSWRLVLASLVPNLLPLVVTFGLIGWMGLPLDPKLGMVFSIAYGIAVDDTIHFLSRYVIERRKGADIDTAIQVTFAETGRAMVLTTIILFFMFGVLVFSPFPPTFTIGVLLSITLAIALVMDLLLNPMVLRWLKV
jgi:uncharacterized protein